MKRPIILLAALLPLTLAAQIITEPLQGELPKGGIVYYLPQTGLHVSVTQRTIVETPGEFARYAQHCLGIKEVITQQSTRREIVGVQATAFTQPDPSQRYCIQALRPVYSEKAKTIAPMPQIKVATTPEGLLRAVNMEPTATWPTKSCPEASSCLQTQAAGCEKAPVGAPLTQEMQLAGSTLRMAELAAKQIFSLRETRLALIQGEVENMPSDGAGLALMLQQLDETEKAYTELFTGSRRESCQTIRFDIVPEKGLGRQVVFRFSSQKGAVGKDDLSGRPVYLNLGPRSEAPLTQVRDSFMVERPTKKTPARMEALPVGLYYYQPVQTAFSIVDAEQTYFEGQCCFAQEGDLLFLEAASDIKVELDPATGAILKR